MGVLGDFNVNSIYRIICSTNDWGGTRKDFAKMLLTEKFKWEVAQIPTESLFLSLHCILIITNERTCNILLFLLRTAEDTLALSRTGQWTKIKTELTQMQAWEKWNMNGNLVTHIQIPFSGGIHSDISRRNLWVTMEKETFLSHTRLD